MKPLVFYYSHSGNKEKLVLKLRDRIACNMYEMKEKKNGKAFPFLPISW